MGRKRSEKDHDQSLDWVERMANFCTVQYGLPPITGRILAWLMICEPAEQSGESIAQAIKASRASITTNMQMLTASHLVSKINRIGERTAYYRVDDDAWDKVMERRLVTLLSFQEVIRDGLSLVGEDNPRSARLRSADASLSLMNELLADWQKAKSAKSKKKTR